MPDEISTDTLYETADAIATEVAAEHLDGVQATLEYLYHSTRDVTPETLREYTPTNLSIRVAEIIVLRLRTEGILTPDRLNETALETVFNTAEILETRDTPPENTVVATLPHDDRVFETSMFEALHENMLALIRSADDSLVVMSPFLSGLAYERLRPALHTAADNGADVTVITRYLTYGDDQDMQEHNHEFVNRVLDDRLLNTRTTCYEYNDDETWTTFHAKVVLADDHTAYLGTANITAQGLGGNLELGVVFRDETVRRLADLVDVLKTSEFIHEVERTPTNKFHRS